MGNMVGKLCIMCGETCMDQVLEAIEERQGVSDRIANHSETNSGKQKSRSMSPRIMIQIDNSSRRITQEECQVPLTCSS